MPDKSKRGISETRRAVACEPPEEPKDRAPWGRPRRHVLTSLVEATAGNFGAGGDAQGGVS